MRLQVAALAQTLAERELTGRLLRLEIEARIRTENAGLSATAAEKLSRADAQYLAHERRSIELGYERDVALAEAESVRWALQLALATEATI